MFGLIANGDVDNLKKYVYKSSSRRVKRSSANGAGKFDRGPLPLYSYQFVDLVLYYESLHDLLDSGAIAYIITDKFAHNLKLKLNSSEKCTVLADKTSGSCARSISRTPTRFGSIY